MDSFSGRSCGAASNYSNVDVNLLKSGGMVGLLDGWMKMLFQRLLTIIKKLNKNKKLNVGNIDLFLLKTSKNKTFFANHAPVFEGKI